MASLGNCVTDEELVQPYVSLFASLVATGLMSMSE